MTGDSQKEKQEREFPKVGGELPGEVPKNKSSLEIGEPPLTSARMGITTYPKGAV